MERWGEGSGIDGEDRWRTEMRDKERGTRDPEMETGKLMQGTRDTKRAKGSDECGQRGHRGQEGEGQKDRDIG